LILGNAEQENIESDGQGIADLKEIISTHVFCLTTMKSDFPKGKK
jgi:hypothetical protein